MFSRREKNYQPSRWQVPAPGARASPQQPRFREPKPHRQHHSPGVLVGRAASMLEKLKTIVPRLIWIMFACISGWHGIQMLWGERLTTGVANILVCLGLVVLAVKWRAVIYYFAPSPIVLRTGVLALILFLGIAYLPFLMS